MAASRVAADFALIDGITMKITAIETLVCHARMRNRVFVKVVIDQPGLFGWSEATLTNTCFSRKCLNASSLRMDALVTGNRRN